MDDEPNAVGPQREDRRRVRRRAAGRRPLDHSLASPCVNVCQMDAENRFCLGCLRSLDEIRDWPILSREEKLAVLSAVKARGLEPEAEGE